MPLANELAGWPRDRLVRLLSLRPDLQAARDLAELARLATSPQSTHTAVADLPAAQRAVLEAVVLLVDAADEDDLLGLDPDADRDAVLAALDDLRDRLLVTETGLRPIGMLRQYLPVPLGLGRPSALVHEHTPLYELERLLALYGERAPRSKAAARELLAAVLSSTAELADSFDRLPPEQLAVLQRYDREGPVLREPGLNVWEGRPPEDRAVQQLLQVGLLAVTASGTVELPREVGLALRYPAVTRFPVTVPARGRRVGPDELAAAGAAAVSSVLTLCDALLRRLGSAPVGLIGSGGVGVKELRGLAKELDADPADVATGLLLLRGVGAVGTTSKDLRPASGERAWSARDDGERWSDLVRAWLAASDPPSSRSRLKAALTFSAYDSRVRLARDRLVRLLDADQGEARSVGQWLDRWHERWPEARRGAADKASLVAERTLREDVLAEAVLLGLLVDGAASPLLGPLLAGSDMDQALAAAAGAGESRVLAQADSTLICTGRPTRAMRLALDRIATVESSAQATIWRVTEASLGRAYDDGDRAEQVLEVLEQYAGTLPQAMAYLVRDAYRRHGRARVGSAASYVVVDDDTMLATALSSKGPAGKALAKLGVRRVAPGVAVSRGAVAATVTALRAAGVPAVVEGAAGEASGPAVRRATATAARLAPLPVRSNEDVEPVVDRILAAVR
ncbi:MAG: hypothetical protein JWM62_2825 [Frankiales bacterium]|nr:hypothetical protein [Frankiales bacterium]